MTAEFGNKQGISRLTINHPVKQGENIYLLDDGKLIPESFVAPKLNHISSLAAGLISSVPKNSPCSSLDEIVKIKVNGTSVVLGQVYGYAVYYSYADTFKDHKFVVSVFSRATGEVLKTVVFNHNDSLLTGIGNIDKSKMCLTSDSLTLVAVITPNEGSLPKLTMFRFTYDPVENTISESKTSIKTTYSGSSFSLIAFSENREICFVRDSTYFKLSTLTATKTAISNFVEDSNQETFCKSNKLIGFSGSYLSVWDIDTQIRSFPTNYALARLRFALKLSDLTYIGIEVSGLNRLVAVTFSSDYSAVTVQVLNNQSLPLDKFYLYRESTASNLYAGNKSWLFKIITDENGAPTAAVESTVLYKRMTHDTDDRDIDIDAAKLVYQVTKKESAGDYSGILLSGINPLESSFIKCVGRALNDAPAGKVEVNTLYGSSDITLPSNNPIATLNSASDGNGIYSNLNTGQQVTANGLVTFAVFGYGAINLVLTGSSGCLADVDVATAFGTSRVASLSTNATSTSTKYAQSADVTVPIVGFAVVSIKCIAGTCYIQPLMTEKLRGFSL